MIAAFVDNLPAICVGALVVLLVLALFRIVEDCRPMTDRRWSRRFRAQRAELRRMRSGRP
ncbi:MAG: hypothetical protein M3619_00760 [Myxococcota bacterium]|nr:hypothetical protein [Myxococcota bacterium]